MIDIINCIPDHALNTEFIEPGCGESFPDGVIHKKYAPCIIIAQATQGSYEVECRGKTIHARDGEAFLSATNDFLTITHHGDPRQQGIMKARWLHVHFTLYDTVDFSSLLNIPMKCDKSYGKKFGRIITELLEQKNTTAEKNPLYKWVRKKELAFKALGLLCEFSSFKKEGLDFIDSSQRLVPIFSYVKKNLGNPISVQDLADVAHMSASRFHVFFMERMRQTPINYVKAVRLTFACHKLIITDCSVAEIAETAGFCNQFHFSREFKSKFKVTPSTYRTISRKFIG
jgi:AraC-like DNA-binding protein